MTDHIADIVYDIPVVSDAVRRHTLAVWVDNEFGVLARVVGLFSGRGYNIESLTVAEVDRERSISRITVVTSGTAMMVEQIKRLLAKMVPVHDVHDLTVDGPDVERELVLLKTVASGADRAEALRLADVFRARVVDSTADSFIFEMTGEQETVDRFIDLMRPLGLTEICRTGVAAMLRGKPLLKS